MRTPTVLLVASVSTALLAGCGDRRPVKAGAAGGEAAVLATVNGVPLTERDLEHRSRRAAATGGAPGHDVSANVLQTLVRDELLYQKGVELGLDREPEYRARVGDLEAQVRAFRRQEMTALLHRWVEQQATVTEAEARAWFDANASLVRTRFHVAQILYKGTQADPGKDREAVRAGTPFAQVAARRLGEPPAGARAPWDLGELYWHQLPEAWRGVVDRLEPGEVSEVVQGQGERSWLVQLLGKRVDPAVSFDTEKDRIVGALRQQKALQLYDRTLADAREKAKVVFAKED